MAKLLPVLCCSVLVVATLMPPVMAPVMAQEAANTAAPDTKTDTAVPSVVFGGEALPVADESPQKKPLPKVRSLFFTAGEIASIRKAVGVYTRILSGEGNALDLFGRMQNTEKQKPASRYFVYPQFYLASLVYNSPEDWTIHINRQRLTTKNPEGMQNIRVTSIDKDKVTIEWVPSDWGKVEEVWSVAPNNQVQVDMRGGHVTFTLRPNQTFSSYAMKVLEGRVMPMVIDTSPKDKGDGKSDKPPVDGKPSAKGTLGGGGGGTEKDYLENLLGGR